MYDGIVRMDILNQIGDRIAIPTRELHLGNVECDAESEIEWLSYRMQENQGLAMSLLPTDT